MRFTDKVALVTGGGSGIGRAAALAFGLEGAKIAVLGHGDMDQEKRVAERIRQSGSNADAMEIKADISQPNQMEAAVQQIINKWGRLDIVFANAGINGLWAPIEDLTIEEWNKTINVNLNGTYYTIRPAVPHLKKQGGAIVVTSSVNGTRMFSNTGATAYSTTKAGQVAMAKMLALELAPFGIRINVICPGWIKTQIDENTEKDDSLDEVKTPVEFPEGAVPLKHGGPGRASEVAKLVLYLASDDASHVTGTEVWIDGAQSLLQG
jgi:NAD(P)-dependent dehydrogenase (short-subunit alcohol dehydrogenase family)